MHSHKTNTRSGGYFNLKIRRSVVVNYHWLPLSKKVGKHCSRYTDDGVLSKPSQICNTLTQKPKDDSKIPKLGRNDRKPGGNNRTMKAEMPSTPQTEN